MKKSLSILVPAAAAAALSAAASTQAGFVYDSALRTNSLTSPSGTAGVSSTTFGDFLDFRFYSVPFISGSIQHASTLGTDSMSFGSFAQISSNSGAFGGPLSGMATADVYFRSTATTVISLGVGVSSQFAGLNSAAGASMSLIEAVSNTTLYTASVNDSSSVELTLAANVLYRLRAMSSASLSSGIGSASSNFSISVSIVPAPGAMAVLGLAGLARRRRR